MLFISRVVGKDKYGVVDTDDGIETIVSLGQLKKCIEKGLKIVGVEATVNCCNTSGKRYVRIDHITVQNFDEVRRTKALVLRGIDVRVRDGTILSIGWDQSRLKQNTTIRLSQFGSRCGGYIFEDRRFTFCAGNEVTVVLDDNILIVKQTFRDVFTIRGLSVDIREVTNDKVVTYVYEEYFLAYNGVAMNMHGCIIDNPDRLHFWEAVDIVYHNRLDASPIPDDINLAVCKKFEPYFRALANGPVDMDTQSNDYLLRQAASRMHAPFWRGSCQDYDLVRSQDDGRMLYIFQRCFIVNYHRVARFINFLQWFSPTEHIKMSYVKLCNRVNNAILDYVESTTEV